MAKANKTKKRTDPTIVACPFCKASVGLECVDPVFEYHLSRVHAAEIQIALDKRDRHIYFDREAA